MPQTRSDLVGRVADMQRRGFRERIGSPEMRKRVQLGGMRPLDLATLATAPIPGVGDIVGGIADIRAIKREGATPENITLAALGALPFVPSGLRIIRSAKEVPERFRRAVEDEIRLSGADKPISRDVIVEMRPDEFLQLARRGEDLDKTRRLEKTLGAGERLRKIPFLILDDTGDVVGVVGHEGRHRARMLKKLGEEKIPVRISRRMGRGDKLPGEVLSEDAFEIEKRLAVDKRELSKLKLKLKGEL